MKKILQIFNWIGILAILFLFFWMLFLFIHQESPSTQEQIDGLTPHDLKEWKALQFDLVDPEQAPQKLRDTVVFGYRLVLHTHELLPNYVGDRLNCSNCHFEGGITTGGVNGGISLAGVASKYPRYNPKLQAIEDLPTRINSCFENSMNGKPLPIESKEMQAIVTYLTWISSRYPIYEGAPWLGIKPLKSKHLPDPTRGELLYKTLCADCHGMDGNGGNQSKNHPGESIPPIFGQHAYNTAAGMNEASIFASFIYYNMPIRDPHLTPGQAVDIAAFVQLQPRPTKPKE